MFGYITADPTQLQPEERARYTGCYCGLCRRLGKLCGQPARMTLTYDMTFLILVLNAVYGGQEHSTGKHCLPHPVTDHTGWYSSWTDYGAWMNLALSYYKCMDDWQDDRSIKARLAAFVLGFRLRKARRLYPRQCSAIEQELNILSGLEKSGYPDPDATAASFGRLMAALFVWQQDKYAPDLSRLGYYLGQFIYLLDARIDLKDDLKNESYNPLTGMINPDIHSVLTMLLAEATAAAHRLPISKDARLIDNILYAGVWMQYEGWKAKNVQAAG